MMKRLTYFISLLLLPSITLAQHSLSFDGVNDYVGISVGGITGNFSVAGSTSGFTGLTTSAVGDIVGVALDMENAKVYFSKNGSWLNSGDPTSGSSGTGAAPVAASTTGLRFFFSGSDSNARTMTTAYNFGGCPAFAISSGNADANGYGNFEYAPPTGYYSLCSKNLAEFG